MESLRAWFGRILGTQPAQDPDDEVIKDPVCGTEIDPGRSAGRSTYRKNTYFFCSSTCQDQFDKDPARFAYEPPAKRGCC